MIAPCTNQLQEHATLTLSVSVQRLSKMVATKQAKMCCLFLRHMLKLEELWVGI